MDNHQQLLRYPHVSPCGPMPGGFVPVYDASAPPVAYYPASLSFPNTGLAAQEAAFAPESWADRPNPSRYEYPVSMHQYTPQEVQGVLRAAERWRNSRVKILTSSVAHSWSPLLDTVHVAIVEPGSGQGSDWLLLVFPQGRYCFPRRRRLRRHWPRVRADGDKNDPLFRRLVPQAERQEWRRLRHGACGVDQS